MGHVVCNREHLPWAQLSIRQVLPVDEADVGGGGGWGLRVLEMTDWAVEAAGPAVGAMRLLATSGMGIHRTCAHTLYREN